MAQRSSSRIAEKAARRQAASGAGPTGEAPVGRFPGATSGFALFGEVLMVGLLVTVASLLVVTVPSALAAGCAHLRRFLRAEDSRAVLFWRDFRLSLRGGALIGVGAVVLTLLLLLDIDLAKSGMLPGGAVVEFVGWAGLVALAVGLLTAASLWSASGRWGVAVRQVPGVLAGDVGGAVYLLATIGFVVAVTWALAPLIVAGLGCAVLAVVALPERPRRR